MSSLREIAHKAGCSTSTVSLVFRGDRSISEATASKVRRIANKLGYKYVSKNSESGNPLQRRIVLATSASTGNPGTVYGTVIDGIAEGCREFGIGFLLHHMKTPEHADALSATKCEGIIFGMSSSEIEQRVIEKVSRPVLKVMGAPDMNWPYDHVTYNNPMIARIAGNYLVQQGQRRVALIYFNDNTIENERVGGVREIIEQNGGKVDTLFLPENISRQEKSELANAFFGAFLKDKGTAVFSTGDACTVYIHQMLLHQGVRPGKDIELISCNNEDILEQLHPRPLSIDIHARSIGRMAVRQLLWRLENPREPAVVLQMSPTLSGI